MGNVLVHLCPNLNAKLSHQYNHIGSDTDESDTTQLYANDAQNNDSLSYALTSDCTEASQMVCKKRLSEEKYQSVCGPKITKEHVNFPFLLNDEIAHWIINTRFMFILRGPPGAGKSYIAECIRYRFPTSQICSADDFWYINSGGLEYEFDVSRMAEAHRWCQNKAYTTAASGISPLVIDNTNVRAWETRFYTDLARQFEYTVIMVTPQTPWRFDADALAMKNVHFVSLQTVEAKVRNFEHVFPLYYGWMWPGSPSKAAAKATNSSNKRTLNTKSELPASWPLDLTHGLLSWAWNSLVTVVGLPDVHIQLASAMGFSDGVPTASILHHWCSTTQPRFGYLKASPVSSIPHITACYTRFGRAPNAQRYGLSSAVTSSLLGRLFTVQVTGLFFSLRTVGVRIRLPNDDLVLRHLWNSDDQAILSTHQPQFDGNCSSSNHVGSLDMHPSVRRPIGCRAHVTLALASDVSAVETGYDLLRIVDSELAQQPGEHVAIIPGGSVRRVTVRRPVAKSPSQSQQPQLQFLTAADGHEYMYVYDLDFPEHHRILFAGAY